MGHLGAIFGQSWGHLAALRGLFLCDVIEDSTCSASRASRYFQSCSHASFLSRSIFVRRHRGFGHSEAVLKLLRGSKLASRWHQDGPNMAPRCPNTATEGPKTAARGPRKASEWPQDAPTGSMIVPRWPQEAPRWLQEVIRWPRQASRWSQEAPTATATARASPLLWGIDLRLHADADVYEYLCSECGCVYV